MVSLFFFLFLKFFFLNARFLKISYFRSSEKYK